MNPFAQLYAYSLQQMDEMTSFIAGLDEKQLRSLWMMMSMIYNSGDSAGSAYHWLGFARGIARAKFNYDFATRTTDDDDFNELLTPSSEDGTLE